MDFNGPVNYIANDVAEINTTGWAAYADAAGTTPVDGTGGSPSSTYTRSTSSPLRGQASFLWTKSAANRQGEGFSYDFLIADADKGKVLQCSFDYAIASGTYADDDMVCYMFDVTNLVLIQPAPYKIKNHTLVSDRYFFEFQAPSNSNSYRLIVHTASTSASAYTLKFDDFILGPQAKLYGSPITDWVSYTPSNTQGFGTITSPEIQYAREGADLLIRAKFTSGTTTASEAQISLPTGMTSADTTKIPSIQMAGAPAFRNISSAAAMFVPLIEPSKTYLTFSAGNVVAGTVAVLTKAGGSSITNSGEVIVFNARVPILGWGSSQLASQDASTRVVAARASGAAASATAGNTIIFPSVDFDTHGGFSSGRYTVPVSGYYECRAWLAANVSVIYSIYVNGTLVKDITRADDAAGRGSGSCLIKVIAGDIIDLRPNITSGANSSAAWFAVNQVQGPAQIMASEFVSAAINSSTTSLTASTDTKVVFTTKEYDTHGAINGSLDTFTAPVAGYYRVTSSIIGPSVAQTLTNKFDILLYKNGSSAKIISLNRGQATATYRMTANGSTEIKCVAGDTLQIYVNADAAGAIPSGAGFATAMFTKIGN